MSISQSIILFFIQLTEPVNPAYIISFNLIVIPVLYTGIQGYICGRILKNIMDIMKIDAIIPDSPAWNYYTYLEVIRDIIIMCINPALAVIGMIMSLVLIPQATEAALLLCDDIFKLSYEMLIINAKPVLIVGFIAFLWRTFTETIVIEDNGQVMEI